MLKIQKYSILEELLEHGLIEDRLAIDISDNIESIYNNETLSNNEDWMQLIPFVPVGDQLLMYDRLFGSEILSNTFMRHLDSIHVIELLNRCVQIHLSAGEHIYKYDQISSHSWLLSLQSTSSSLAESTVFWAETSASRSTLKARTSETSSSSAACADSFQSELRLRPH